MLSCGKYQLTNRPQPTFLSRFPKNNKMWTSPSTSYIQLHSPAIPITLRDNHQTKNASLHPTQHQKANNKPDPKTMDQAIILQHHLFQQQQPNIHKQRTSSSRIERQTQIPSPRSPHSKRSTRIRRSPLQRRHNTPKPCRAGILLYFTNKPLYGLVRSLRKPLRGSSRYNLFWWS